MDKVNIFNDFLQKIQEFIKEYEENEQLNIQQIEIEPKLFNRIFFNVPVYYKEDYDRQLNNIFIIFFLQYVYKKIDMTLQNYMKYLNDLYTVNSVEHIINVYKSYGLKLNRMNRKQHVIQIDYSSVQDDIVKYEIGSDDTLRLNILTHMFNKQSGQIQQLYFYIFPMFLNWINDYNIKFNDVEKWSEFFNIDVGW